MLLHYLSECNRCKFLENNIWQIKMLVSFQPAVSLLILSRSSLDKYMQMLITVYLKQQKLKTSEIH